MSLKYELSSEPLPTAGGPTGVGARPDRYPITAILQLLSSNRYPLTSLLLPISGGPPGVGARPDREPPSFLPLRARGYIPRAALAPSHPHQRVFLSPGRLCCKGASSWLKAHQMVRG